MGADAATPLRSPAADGAVVLRQPAGGLRGMFSRADERRASRLLDYTALAALVAIVAPSALLVVLTSAHASFMTPTATSQYFPAWMAGPLRALWPGGALGEHSMQTLVTAILACMYLGYLVAVGLSRRLSVRATVAAIVAVHAIYFLAAPLQYTDIFNYINYARMGVLHNLNPYVTPPILGPHNDATFAISNWHWLVSPYGTLFTLLTYALVPLGVAGGFWTLKLILCASSLAVLMLVWSAARELGRDPVRSVVLVGLNPIVLVWGLGADHNDMLMVLPLVIGVRLLIRARVRSREGSQNSGRPEAGAAAAFVAATGIKVSAAVVLPIAFAASPRRASFAWGGALAAVVIAIASAVAFGAHLPGIASQTELVTGVGPANLFGWALGQGGETATLKTLLTILTFLVVVGASVAAVNRERDWIALAGASLLAVWLTTSWFAPWYIVWVLPFAALASRRRLARWTLAIGVYILIAFGPQQTPLLHAIHFNPFGSPVGQRHYEAIHHAVQ
jgi:hypothetical protein